MIEYTTLLDKQENICLTVNMEDIYQNHDRGKYWLFESIFWSLVFASLLFYWDFFTSYLESELGFVVDISIIRFVGQILFTLIIFFPFIIMFIWGYKSKINNSSYVPLKHPIIGFILVNVFYKIIASVSNAQAIPVESGVDFKESVIHFLTSDYLFLFIWFWIPFFVGYLLATVYFLKAKKE